MKWHWLSSPLVARYRRLFSHARFQVFLFLGLQLPRVHDARITLFYPRLIAPSLIGRLLHTCTNRDVGSKGSSFSFLGYEHEGSSKAKHASSPWVRGEKKTVVGAVLRVLYIAMQTEKKLLLLSCCLVTRNRSDVIES